MALFLALFLNASWGWAPGADSLDRIVALTSGKKIGWVGNPASRLSNGTPTVDALIGKGLKVEAILVPDRSFRSHYEEGAPPPESKDEKTGVEIRRLPLGLLAHLPKDALRNLEVLVWDLQDAGARPFLYTTLLQSLLRECARTGISFVVLDRPNPQGRAVDGPLPDPKFYPDVAPVPFLHGLTHGELAKYLVSSKSFPQAAKLNLEIVPMPDWSPDDLVSLPVPPSPNLRDERSLRLYPSFALLDATVVSVGRGTPKPFQWIGHPDFSRGWISFVPKPIPGVSPFPLFNQERCFGMDFSQTPLEELRKRKKLDLSPLLQFLEAEKGDEGLNEQFFEPDFDRIAGTPDLRRQLLRGESEAQIRASWQDDLNVFVEARKTALLYPPTPPPPTVAETTPNPSPAQ